MKYIYGCIFIFLVSGCSGAGKIRSLNDQYGEYAPKNAVQSDIFYVTVNKGFQSPLNRNGVFKEMNEHYKGDYILVDQSYFEGDDMKPESSNENYSSSGARSFISNMEKANSYGQTTYFFRCVK